MKILLVGVQDRLWSCMCSDCFEFAFLEKWGMWVRQFGELVDQGRKL